MNGALTIGTLDGANIEIREQVGEENFFLFGLTAHEVRQKKEQGYCPAEWYEKNPELHAVVDLIDSGLFSRGDRELFRPLTQALKERDENMLFADYPSYVKFQHRVGERYRDAKTWTRMSILNVARIGEFSSDRAIREYARDIWHVEPVHVRLPPGKHSIPV